MQIRQLFAAVAFLLACTCSLTAYTQTSAPTAGQMPPIYAGQQLDGTEINIDAESGKAYVITFWANWCAPCLQELPVLSNVQRIAGPERIKIIAINIQDREIYRKLERHIIDIGLTSTYDPNRKAHDSFAVKAIPHMIIIGRDGRIVSVRKGYARSELDELAKDINQALAVAPKPPRTTHN